MGLHVLSLVSYKKKDEKGGKRHMGIELAEHIVTVTVLIFLLKRKLYT